MTYGEMAKELTRRGFRVLDGGMVSLEPNESIEHHSKNIAIPEKKRGWEFQDMQYHGGMYCAGEW